MDENIEEKKPQNRWKSVGINILVLSAYTLIFRFVDGGIIMDAFLIAIHFTVCILAAIIVRKWEWVLSAFLVLAIGFSTCVSFLDVPNLH
jgi:hypothetical protein